MDMVTVKSAVTDRIALWQKHPDQPGGEVFVAGDIVAQVALTDEVKLRLRNDILAETKEPTTMPLSDYDTLTEETLLSQLASMTDIERILVRQYEAVHQNRASIMTQEV